MLSERGDGEASGVPLHEVRTFGAGTRHAIIPLITRFEAQSAEPSFAFDQAAAASRFEVKEGLRELLRSPPVVPFGRNCRKREFCGQRHRPEMEPCEMSHIKRESTTIWCEICGRSRHAGASCVKTVFLLRCRVYFRRPNDDQENCCDCGTPKGGLHHMGCRMERCPKCGQRLLSCGCFDRGRELVP